ncbi:hypothetical protein ACWDKQ_24330 [Saccharopolyspora sp. NPDC000995]
MAVTGLGIITPAGIGVEENWKQVAEGCTTAATGILNRLQGQPPARFWFSATCGRLRW